MFCASAICVSSWFSQIIKLWIAHNLHNWYLCTVKSPHCNPRRQQRTVHCFLHIHPTCFLCGLLHYVCMSLIMPPGQIMVYLCALAVCARNAWMSRSGGGWGPPRRSVHSLAHLLCASPLMSLQGEQRCIIMFFLLCGYAYRYVWDIYNHVEYHQNNKEIGDWTAFEFCTFCLSSEIKRFQIIFLVQSNK